jgi:hypothetical protein
MLSIFCVFVEGTADDDIPEGVNMFKFCKQYIAGYAGTIAGHVARAPDWEHAKETMEQVMAKMKEIESYVQMRDSDISNPGDGRIPRKGGSSKRILRASECRKSKKYARATAHFSGQVVDNMVQLEVEALSHGSQEEHARATLASVHGVVIHYLDCQRSS